MKLAKFLVVVLTVKAVEAADDLKLCDGMQLAQGRHRSWNLVKVNKVIPKLCDNVAQSSGTINTYFGDQFFFWYFESRHQPQKDPLIVYINGALGSSSILGLNSGMFPCHVNSYGNGTWRNPFSWNNFANLLFLDPLGVGFTPKERGEGCDAKPHATGLVNALRQFLRAHPTLLNVPIHLAGESYGAAIVLQTAQMIVRINSMNDEKKIQLKSVIVGSAMLDAYHQYSVLPFLASKFKMKLGSVKRCQDVILKCRNDEAFCEVSIETCIANLIHPYLAAGFNIFQLPGFEPQSSKSMDLTNLILLTETFLNLNHSRNELGIPPHYNFNYINPLIFERASKSGDYIKDHSVTIAELSRSNIKVLYYGGGMDYICNPLGFISALIVTNVSPLKSLLTGAEMGSVFYTNRLSAIKFTNASHYVQIDQPQILYEVITRWINKLSV